MQIIRNAITFVFMILLVPAVLYAVSGLPDRALKVEHTLQEYTTETGAQTAIDIHPMADVTFAVDVGASDDVDVEVNLVEGGTYYKAVENITADYLDTLEGPIRNIRINIVTNTSNDIKFDVLSVYGGR